MSSNRKRSASEIEEQRKIAMDRLKMRKMNDHSINLQNNCLPPPPQDAGDLTRQKGILKQTNQNLITISAEQKALIEKNRLAALEKAKANGSRMISLSVASEQAPSSSKFQNPVTRGEIDSQNFGSKIPALQLNSHKKIVNCTSVLVSEDRFSVQLDKCDKAATNLFDSMPIKKIDTKNKMWTFELEVYDILMMKLVKLSHLKVNPIPAFVLKAIKMKIEESPLSCLDKIEPSLVESLFPFQKQSILFGISREGRFLLGDDMGLGKTRQAIAIADYYKEDWPLLIVTTAATRDMWNEQIYELLPNVLIQEIAVINSKNLMISDAKVVICSYSAMETSMRKLIQKKFGVIIFDESHSLKNNKSKQTNNAIKLAESSKRVILISGTPALSRPCELRTQLALIDKHFSNYFQFTQRYCEGKTTRFGWEANGAANLDELSIVLKKKFMIRRTKEEVCLELGEKKRKVVFLKNVQLSQNDEKDMQKFNDLYENGNRKNGQNELLIKWYASTAKIKSPAVCQYVRKLFENIKNCEKYLIFASHHHLMNELASTLSDIQTHFIRIDGSTPADQRNTLVSRFQNDPNIRCAILSIRAASSGITLTAASNVIFAELDWTPSNILQAEGRAHRIGQERPVHTTFLIAPGTADEVIWKKLQTKQQNLDKLGLLAKNESLDVSDRKSEGVSAKASSSKITNYFEATKSEDKNDFSFEFLEEDFHQILQTIEDAEKKSLTNSIVKELLQGIDFDDDF